MSAPAHPPIDPIAREYLEIAWGIERLRPGFIDGYFGPEEIKLAALANAADAPALLRRAEALRAAIAGADLPDDRRAFLAIQTRAMATSCRALAGEEIPYEDEVRLLFDIEPARTPEDLFAEAAEAMQTLLPGDGTVQDRLAAWRKRFEIAPERARHLIDLIMAEARARTAAFVDLPLIESIEVTFVSDQPWSGYNWYLGDGRSRVEINTDLPIRANALLDLICHEAYPGHHAEHALKELTLYRDRGWGEFAAQLIHTPEAVVSEGIATLAEGVIFPGEEAARFANEVLYPAAGVSGDPDREARLSRASRALRAVSANVALLLHADGRPEEDAIAYLVRYGLSTETEARHRLRFMTDPMWRAYIFCYHAGRDLLGAWLAEAGDDQAFRQSRFRRLLTEPVSPSLVAGWM
jgi:hypothetical protein